MPWEIAGAAWGSVKTDGRVTVHVRGLVFADDDEVPPELRGKNDEAEFRALVSCLSEDEAGNVTTANVTTAGFPANEAGNSDIETEIELPNPCVAPIVLVLAGSEEKWFAADGFESEEDE